MLLEPVFTSPYLTGAVTLTASLIVALIAPIPRHLQPLFWFSYLAQQLADKVHHPNRSHTQQYIAGAMATILLIIPFWLIITFLLQLAAFPWFFEFIILYCCLNDDNFKQVAHEVSQSLKQQDNQKAKQLLSPWLYRDIAPLSSIGLAKATIERLVITPIYGTVATILFFLIGGAPLVLLARMLKQLTILWPFIAPDFRQFGLFSYFLSSIFYLVPSWCVNLTLAIQGGPSSIAYLFTPKKFKDIHDNSSYTHAISAKILTTELGGPMKLSGQRVMTAIHNFGPHPTEKTLDDAIKLITNTQRIWIGATIILQSVWIWLSLN